MEELIVPVKFSGSRETKTYVFLFKTAKHALSEAEKSEEARIYNLMTVYVFLAFSFEAYINHLGAKTISNWEEKERKWGQEGRRNKVFEKLKLTVNYEKSPYSAIPELFIFRDSLAHGRTEVVNMHNEVKNVNWNNIDLEQVLIPTWLNNCTIENSRKAFDSIEQIINILGEKAGEKYPLKSLGKGSFSYERLDKA